MNDLKERIYDLLKDPQLMSFATVTKDNKPWVRYVWASASPDLTIIFPTFINSRKADQISANPEVHITCGVTSPESAQEYLQVCGIAEISTDRDLLLKHWDDGLKTYYTGPYDPNYCLCLVKPYLIELNTMTDMTPLIWRA